MFVILFSTTVASYFASTFTSLTVYFIGVVAFLSAYFGRAFDVYFHPFSAVTVIVSTTSFPFNISTVIVFGLVFSWSL